MNYSKDTHYKQLIQSTRWQRVRNQFLKDHPTCEICGKLATEVHHRIPLNNFRNDPIKMEQMAFDPNNLQALCHDDHIHVHIELGKFNHKQEYAAAYRKEKLDTFYKNYFE